MYKYATFISEFNYLGFQMQIESFISHLNIYVTNVSGGPSGYIIGSRPRRWNAYFICVHAHGLYLCVL